MNAEGDGKAPARGVTLMCGRALVAARVHGDMPAMARAWPHAIVMSGIVEEGKSGGWTARMRGHGCVSANADEGAGDRAMHRRVHAGWGRSRARPWWGTSPRL